MKTVSLSKLSDKIGFGCVLFVIFGASIAFGVAVGSIFAGLGIFSFSALCLLPMFRAIAASMGKSLEFDDESIALLAGDHEVWRIRWDKLAGIELSSNLATWLVGTSGERLRIPSVNLGLAARNGLRLRVPGSATPTFAMPSLKIPAGISWTVLAGGVALTVWGCMGWAKYIALIHKFEDTLDPSIQVQLKSLSLPGLAAAILIGALLSLAAGADRISERFPPKPVPADRRMWGDSADLASHLAAGEFSPWFSNGQLFRASDDIAKLLKKDFAAIAAYLLLFGSIFGGLVLGAVFAPPKEAFWCAPVSCMYFPTVLLGLYFLRTTLLEQKTITWKIMAVGSNIQAISPEGERYAVKKRGWGRDTYLMVLDAGQPLALNPKWFVPETSESR